MSELQQPPLNWEASATATHPQVYSSLPHEVESCLKIAHLLHLATCDALFPHLSLMNYTYLPSTPFNSTPVIIMTTNLSSRKTINMIKNPRVELLVHDWVSHRPPTVTPGLVRDGSPPPRATRSSLANLLLSINTSALSRISTTINGEAKILESGSEEEIWCKEKHLENITFEDEAGEERGTLGATQGSDSVEGNCGARSFAQREEVRVVLVNIRQGRIADQKGGVKDWSLVAEAAEEAQNRNGWIDGVS